MSEAIGAPTATTSLQVSDVPASKSYANAVSSRPSLSKFNVHVDVVDGLPTVPTVPDEVFEDSTPLWEDFLIGRFPESAPHVAKIHVIVNKIWNLGDKNIRIDVFAVNDTMVKFRIRNESARLRALRRGMWNICDLPMIVSKWTPIAEDAQPEIKSMPMWVVIKNVPHSMFTWKGLSYLTSPVGHPKRLHQETELVTNFDEAKFFVEVNMTQDLLHRFHFKVQGEETHVTYDYPWLPPRCGGCHKWGHSEDGCLAALGRANSPSKSLRGSDMAVSNSGSPPRQTASIDQIVKVTEPVSEPSNTEPVAELGTEVTSEKEISEHEEGEIPVSGGDGEWSKVTSSGGKNSNSASKALVYGEVRIASPTRYAVLQDNDKEGDTLFSSISGKDLLDELDKSQIAEAGRAGSTLRVPPPRNSKNTHRFLSNSSNKARDSVPNQTGKRNPPKKP